MVLWGVVNVIPQENPCQKKASDPLPMEKTKPRFPMISAEEGQRISSAQPTLSLEDKLIQIRRSLGRPLDGGRLAPNKPLS